MFPFIESYNKISINENIPVCSNFIDNNIEDLNSQDIIDKYDDEDLDKMKIIEPIVLPGIHSRVFNYLLELFPGFK